MKALVVVRTVDGRQDVNEYDNIIGVKAGTGALELTQRIDRAEQTTGSGLVLLKKEEEKVTFFIPWYRIESVKVG
jgi:hypothetical protein